MARPVSVAAGTYTREKPPSAMDTGRSGTVAYVARKLRSAAELIGSSSSVTPVAGGISGVARFCTPAPTRTTPKSPSDPRRSHSRKLSTIDQRSAGAGCR